MVATDAIEGIVDAALWFHYDIKNDVLYLRLVSAREAATYADIQDDGSLLLRRQDNDDIAGLTIIDWWEQCGSGAQPDSLQVLEAAIEPAARKLAA